jgi:[glutamine synthetase] adenylyltransferase / [glutamine synthetase]-adenylyl-L-tyrosine phosphorylase
MNRRQQGGAMKASVWQAAVRTTADPIRAEQGFAQLAEAGTAAVLDTLTEDHARIIAALFAGSQAMSLLLLKHPEWISSLLTPENLAYPRQEQGLRREVHGWLEPALKARDYPAAFTKLREFKQREMLRIAARDLARLGDGPGITREISNVADVCLGATLQLCRQQLTERLGTPYHQDADSSWQPTQFAVMGLGKLGGQELNYSSDVDVIFVYSEEGQVFKEPPRKGAAATERALTNHQFFKRLAEAFIAEVARSTPQGMLYRIDLRLRPEGDAGPLVRSFASYETFYAQWGQTWERMMLLKARCVAGDAAIAAEFLEMVQPFRYPRSLGEGTLREIAGMKTRIENEVVKSGEMERNVKLGRGGIREIEFIVQTAQILNSGRIPFLQGAQTLPMLEKLAEYKLLSDGEARDLASAYCFLRDVEHRVQMENNLQTHTIPVDPKARERLARLMGFPKLKAFDAALKRHNQRVRELYEKLVKVEVSDTASPFPKWFRGAEAQWKAILQEHRFRDVEKSFRLLNELANGPGYVHVSQRTTELAMELIPRILALCAQPAAGHASPVPPASSANPKGKASLAASRTGASSRSEPPFRPARSGAGVGLKTGPATVLSDPDRVLARLDSFISAYGGRATLFETWTRHPQLFELLLLLFDRSEFLAEMAIRTPDLVDELVLSGRLGRKKTTDEILAELRHGRDDADQRLWIRRYHQAEFMRIGLRSILGLADHEHNLLELSALADACVEYALEVSLRKHKCKSAPLVIIGLGKLGGRELNYGSDLDIMFVAGDKARKDLPKIQKVAVEVMDLLSSPTELGIAFVTDARLRPDGEKGLLVNTLGAYDEYYRRRAQLWEIQSLTRTRPVAGDRQLGEQFQSLATELTNFKWFAEQQAEAAPACYTPDWKQQVARMRARIEKERTPAGQDALAFKTGSGGVMDAEFIAQAMCIENGWHEANTLCALQRIRGDKVLAPQDADKLIENYRQLRRLEGILRRWSFEGEVVLPVDPEAYYRVAVRCGFQTAEAFRDALARWRKAIREVYLKVFPS